LVTCVSLFVNKMTRKQTELSTRNFQCRATIDRS